MGAGLHSFDRGYQALAPTQQASSMAQFCLEKLGYNPSL